MDIINMVFSFLIGTAVGVIIAHSWNTHVANQAITKINNIFDRLWHQHPKLLQEMKQDMDNPAYRFQREFFVLKKNQRFNLNLAKLCLVYFIEEHDGLQDQLKTLEDYGFVSNVTEPNKNNLTKYQLSEKFVELLRNKQT